MKRMAGVLLAFLLAAGVPVLSEYARADIRQVPVDRLAANFEGQLRSDPGNVNALIGLARLHGMAYALKTEQVDAVDWRRGEGEVPWYGYPGERKNIPYEAKQASSAEARRRAEAHLADAIRLYERALEVEPGNLLARLGYGWMLDQSARRTDAISEYRRVITDAWREEQFGKPRSILQPFFTEEASAYLIRLLDQKADAAEIEDLRRKQRALGRFPRAITPIAVPLGDDVPPERMVDAGARVVFDADGSGLKRRWSWISRDAGWLVYDADGTGEITSALQLFGNVTFWLFWENGYEALASLDDNADGELKGPELRRLAIWHDTNADGRSDRGEVRPLEAHGIVALSCRSVEGDRVRFAAISGQGVRFVDGRTRPTYDVILRRALETTF